MITEIQKNQVRQWVKNGNKLEAVKYVKETFNISLKEAKTLVDHIDDDLDSRRFGNLGGDTFLNSNRRTRSNNFSYLFGGIFAVVGAGLLAGAIYLFSHDFNITKISVPVKGKVIDYPSKPLIQYQYNGQIYTYQSTVQSNPPSYTLGEEVEILINPDNPNELIVNTFTDRWFAISILGGLGFIFFIVGLSSAIFLRL